MQSPVPDDVRRLEDEIARLKARLAQLRRSAPRPMVPDYTLRRGDGSPVRLSELFNGKPDLLIIHNMGRSCPYCTLWADGFNGVAEHLASRAGVALVSPDQPATLEKFSKERGWRFPVVSSHGSPFTRDLGFEPETGKQWPGASGLRRNADGSIVRVAAATFGPGDDFCSVWHLFDLLAEVADGWQPKDSYERN
jgi:predicted dithiol-disulfide oxidoreductase (DUF899 family)